MSVDTESSSPSSAETAELTGSSRRHRTRSRWLAALAMAPVLAGTAVFVAPAASAAPAQKSTITGKPLNAYHNKATYSVDPFDVVNKATGQSVGTGTFKLTSFSSDASGQTLLANGVVTVTNAAGQVIGSQAVQAPAIDPPANCTILDLNIPPIDLNLLGLEVAVPSGIHLVITAHQGQGLLGDLLCSVDNLLNGGLGNPLATLLNSLLGLLNGL